MLRETEYETGNMAQTGWLIMHLLCFHVFKLYTDYLDFSEIRTISFSSQYCRDIWWNKGFIDIIKIINSLRSDSFVHNKIYCEIINSALVDMLHILYTKMGQEAKDYFVILVKRKLLNCTGFK